MSNGEDRYLLGLIIDSVYHPIIPDAQPKVATVPQPLGLGWVLTLRQRAETLANTLRDHGRERLEFSFRRANDDNIVWQPTTS